jgi:UDP-N-acetyl-D-glucosamine dehydrogenase
MRRHDLRMESVALDERTIGSYDAVLISTAHAAVDYELLARHAKLVVDTRNAMAPWAGELAGRLVKA